MIANIYFLSTFFFRLSTFYPDNYLQMWNQNRKFVKDHLKYSQYLTYLKWANQSSNNHSQREDRLCSCGGDPESGIRMILNTMETKVCKTQVVNSNYKVIPFEQPGGKYRITITSEQTNVKRSFHLK